jgi:hypothetical protein
MTRNLQGTKRREYQSCSTFRSSEKFAEERHLSLQGSSGNTEYQVMRKECLIICIGYIF